MNKNTKKIAIIAVFAIALLAVSVYFFQVRPAAEFAAQNAAETIVNEDLSFEFKYTAGPDALSMFEPSVNRAPLLGSYVLLPSQDFVAIRNQESSDTPPTISIFVYDFSDTALPFSIESLGRSEKVLAWARANQALTGLSEDIEPQAVELDGVTGFEYQYPSTYNQTIRLHSYDNKLYMFVGQYENQGDQMQKFFDDVLESVLFN